VVISSPCAYGTRNKVYLNIFSFFFECDLVSLKCTAWWGLTLIYLNFFIILTRLRNAATDTTRRASQTGISAHTSPIFSCFSAAGILALAGLYRVESNANSQSFISNKTVIKIRHTRSLHSLELTNLLGRA